MSTFIAAVLGGAASWLLPSAVLYLFFRRSLHLLHCRCGEWRFDSGSFGVYDEESEMLHERFRCFPTREYIGETEE